MLINYRQSPTPFFQINQEIRMKKLTMLSAIIAIGVSNYSAAGGGHATSEPTLTAEYSRGDDGYRHTGLIFGTSVGEWTLGATYHTVKESDGESVFPSLGLQAGYKFREGLLLEGFTFAYLEKEEQKSLAFGVRLETELMEFDAFDEEAHVSLLLSPVYADVTAIEEDSELPVDIAHRMLFTSLTLGTKYFSASVVASWSSFSRDNIELETRTDLGEMTHSAIYENNDGFPDDSIGLEVLVTPIERLSFYLGAANIDFPGLPLRKSRRIAIDYEIMHELAIGISHQTLRGGEGDNNITGIELSYTF